MALESRDKPPAHRWTDGDPALSKFPRSQVGRGGQLPASWPWLCGGSPSVAPRQKGVSFLSSTWTAPVFGKVIGSEGTRLPPAMGVAFCPAAEVARLISNGFRPGALPGIAVRPLDTKRVEKQATGVCLPSLPLSSVLSMWSEHW